MTGTVKDVTKTTPIVTSAFSLHTKSIGTHTGVSSKFTQSISSVDVKCLDLAVDNDFNAQPLSYDLASGRVDIAKIPDSASSMPDSASSMPDSASSMPDCASSMPPYCSLNNCQSNNFVGDMYVAISNSIADSIPCKRRDCLKRLEIHGETSLPVLVRGRPNSVFHSNRRMHCEQQAGPHREQKSIRTIYRPTFQRVPSVSDSIEEQGDSVCPSVSGRLSVSTLESGVVCLSCFHVGYHWATCHPSLYIQLRRRRDPVFIDLMRRRRCVSTRNRKQFYVAGAILIMIGISSVIVNVVGIVIHSSWTFTGIGIWSGVCNIICGWAAIISAQQKFNNIGNCLRGLAVWAVVCSGFQIAFGVVGLTVRDFYYSIDMKAEDGTTEVNVVLVVFGCLAFVLNLWLAILLFRSQEYVIPKT